MVDGVESLNNILVIGMTNRKELIDEAILRPGRFEVHIEINLPDEKGRKEIFRIHTKEMLDNNIIDIKTKFEDFLEHLAKKTNNFTGAEIEAVVRAASSLAF